MTIRKAEFDGEFLLQTSYRQGGSREDFSTSRSRIVTFERRGHTLRMTEAAMKVALTGFIQVYFDENDVVDQWGRTLKVGKGLVSNVLNAFGPLTQVA